MISTDPVPSEFPAGVSEWVTATLEGTGVSNTGEAHHTLVAVLDAMGEVLTQDEAEAIARELPEALATVLRGAAHRVGAPPNAGALDAFVHGVEWRENLPRSFAFEHASAVCRVLASRLSPGTRSRLAADLPRAVAELLAPEAPAPRTPHLPRAPAVAPRNTLASGRPFSEHPLSEAGAETAHKGLTQERLGDSLASGLPGPARKISESH